MLFAVAYKNMEWTIMQKVDIATELHSERPVRGNKRSGSKFKMFPGCFGKKIGNYIC